jgi:hypothetical protein
MVPELAGRAHADHDIAPQELAGRLLCDVDAAQELLAHLHSSHPRTRAAFSRWWTTGEIENITLRGVSIRDVQEHLDIDPLRALLLMDAVLQGRREPQDLLHADVTAQ